MLGFPLVLIVYKDIGDQDSTERQYVYSLERMGGEESTVKCCLSALVHACISSVSDFQICCAKDDKF